MSVSKFTQDNIVFFEFHPHQKGATWRKFSSRIVCVWFETKDQLNSSSSNQLCSLNLVSPTNKKVAYISQFNNLLGHASLYVFKKVLTTSYIPFTYCINAKSSLCASCQLSKSCSISFHFSIHQT